MLFAAEFMILWKTIHNDGIIAKNGGFFSRHNETAWTVLYQAENDKYQRIQLNAGMYEQKTSFNSEICSCCDEPTAYTHTHTRNT